MGNNSTQEFFQIIENNKWGIKTFKNDLPIIVIPALYDRIEPYSDGLFHVAKGEDHAYFDANGNIVIPFQKKYDSYGEFAEGLARVKKDERWGYIDKAGNEIITPQFFFAENFSDGMAVVRDSRFKHGAIDRSGKILIAHQYHFISKFNNGYAHFGDLKTWGLINKEGIIILPQQYIYIGKVEDGKVVVQIQEGEIYKEGIFTIGGTIEWNNNLDNLNQQNKLIEQYKLECSTLIDQMYLDSCPCQYPKFQNYIVWKEPIRFLDQELVFSEFSKRLEKHGDDSFKCKVCKTLYCHSMQQLNVNLCVQNVKITEGLIVNEGAASADTSIPIFLGFQGLGDLSKCQIIEKYTKSEFETVLRYLTLK